MEQSIQELWENFLWFNLCVIGNPGGEEGENEKKNILRDSG